MLGLEAQQESSKVTVCDVYYEPDQWRGMRALKKMKERFLNPKKKMCYFSLLYSQRKSHNGSHFINMFNTIYVKWTCAYMGLF